MIDLSTMRSLELIQNSQNARSKDCLYGLLNQTLTPMGSRLLKSNVLQPSTDRNVLEKRWDALHELTNKEDVFFAVRQGILPRRCTHSCLPTIPFIWRASATSPNPTHQYDSP